mmetsp:Transcript_3669/g.8547  ORF Transcript_3669/g.8547 Transcript_3669/m.8547 type:complete len:276 (+) Transcript_3669:409-1236(+)
MYDRGTFLPLNKLGNALLMESTGMAKPIPSPKSALMLIMPITSPSSFSIGPPLFPWLTAASVCMSGCLIQSKPVSPVDRSSDDTIPSVHVFCKPNGLPRTMDQSPVFTVLLVPRGMAGRGSFALSFTRRAAMSMTSSISRSSHSREARFPGKLASILSAPCTTCAFVRTTPDEPSMQNPLPWPLILRSCWLISGLMPKKKEKISALPKDGISTFCSVWIRTTAAPHFSATRFTKLSLTWRATPTFFSWGWLLTPGTGIRLPSTADSGSIATPPGP